VHQLVNKSFHNIKLHGMYVKKIKFEVFPGHLPGCTEGKKETFQDILCSIEHAIVLLFHKCYYIRITWKST